MRDFAANTPGDTYTDTIASWSTTWMPVPANTPRTRAAASGDARGGHVQAEHRGGTMAEAVALVRAVETGKIHMMPRTVATPTLSEIRRSTLPAS